MVKRVLSPNGGVSQDEINRLGTFWGGVEAVLETPGFIHKKLETMLKRAQQTEGDK